MYISTYTIPFVPWMQWDLAKPPPHRFGHRPECPGSSRIPKQWWHSPNKLPDQSSKPTDAVWLVGGWIEPTHLKHMRKSNWIMDPGEKKYIWNHYPNWFLPAYTEITIHWKILAIKIGFCWCFFSAQTIHIASWLKVKILNLRSYNLAQSHLSYVWAVAALAIYRGANFLGPIILIHSHSNDLSLAPHMVQMNLEGFQLCLHQQCSSVKKKEVKLHK